MINSLTENEIRKLRQLLRTIPCNGVTTYTAGEGITITDTTCCNIKEITSAVLDTEGNRIIADSSNNTVSVGAGASHDIPNFSGMLIVNDHFNGAVETWICGGGGTAVLLGNTPYGPGIGDVTINGGINGYTWTNTNDQLGPFTFTVIKTRNGA